MFRKLRQLLASENLLDSAYKITLMMLEFDREMFEASRRVLRESDTAELPFDIRKTDRRINKYEREVRRQVLTHLAVSGTPNLVAGLVLVSIVIDVERIGDYTKNIYELAKIHPERLDGGRQEDHLRQMESAIQLYFPKVIESLKTRDKGPAREVMEREAEIGKLGDRIVADMITHDDAMSTRQAVSIAMYARYLKRIDAHLTNIASAVVNPFPRIGFREKKT